LDSRFDPKSDLNRSNIAESLREQAASCRRLAAAARTSAGTKSLGELANTFDERARKLDPSREDR
jgi:hypothetical protein